MNKPTIPNPLKPKVKSGSRFKIVGLGGVGGIAARYLSIFVGGQHVPASITYIDGDEFEPKNASRMFFGDFGNKAEVVRKEMLKRFTESQVSLIAIPSYVTEENVKELIKDGDIVLLCLDNHTSRKLINKHCQKLKNVVLISGGNDGIGEDSSGKTKRGTYGNVQIYVRKDGKDVTADLTKFHPEIKNPADKHPEDLSCTEAMESTPQILFANLATASHMLNTLYLYLSNATHYQEMCFDIAEGLSKPMIPATI